MLRLVLCALLALAAAEKTRYDGYKVYRLDVETERHVELVNALHDIVELDFWSETDVMVPPEWQSTVEDMMKERILQYAIINHNVQEELDAEEEITAKRENEPYNLYTWNTYAQIVAAVDDFVASCPSGYSCNRVSLGSSHEGRDVPALTITSGNKPEVYLDSLIHCREWIAGSTVLLIADRLINGNDAEAQRLRSTYNWYIAPVINPDGYVYTWSTSRLWRKNRQPNSGSSCVGTDLNRNFDANWMNAGTSTNPCSDTYGGASAASAVEVRNVQNVLRNRNLHTMISYHSYGNMWLHAYGHIEAGRCARSPYHSSINAVALAARNAAQATGGQSWIYGSVCETIYAASGATVDFAHDNGGSIYSFTPELRGNSFAPAESQISPSYLESWAALVATVDAI